jgi:acyl-CoA-binding protein
MSDLKLQFEQAAQQAKALPARPDNETMLKLYSLYKQATTGDVSGKRPGFTDFVGRAKYDAWAALRGNSPDEAMRAYIDLVNKLSGHTPAAS